ncbi:MAG: hypothetical protein OK456_00745 [Thaumarchaeota archaeon]|nr:hypothetical protein [Nitrososphaerota archaeon]
MDIGDLPDWVAFAIFVIVAIVIIGIFLYFEGPLCFTYACHNQPPLIAPVTSHDSASSFFTRLAF